jgi:predicted NBD/HSP70 family sugar kinase
MSELAVIAMDVGGTTVDAACISAAGGLIGEVVESASPAAGTKDEIVTELARALAAARAQAGDFTVTACGIAMPAPFDYAAGVSHMEHKFQAINGVDLGRLLVEITGLPTYFINDADAFGLGVSWRQLPDAGRFVALTIGTGLGGSFIENGENVTAGDIVPPHGEVWDLPYSGGILEDYVSARGVVAAYDRLSAGERPGTGGGSGGGAGRVSAKEIADLSLLGSEPAVEAYRAMGTAIGRGLAPVLLRFEPEVLVIGGKVGQSLPLFGPAAGRALAEAGLPDLPIIPAAAGNIALWGAARYPLTA